MDLLRSCPVENVDDLLRQFPHAARISAPRAHQSLALVSNEPLAIYLLDGAEWGAKRKRPDGVLIADLNGSAFVCFFELKGRESEERNPDDQIAEGARHFCHSEEHGRAHHDRWSNEEDLPQSAPPPRRRRQEEIRPLPQHRVFGVVVTSRGGARSLPRNILVGDTTIRIITVQRHAREPMGLDELATQLGVI